jgi:ABC-type transport system involved in multi-copper enzyme maturation permease subunit
MRLFAEEQSTGTLEMLMTAPVREWQVVFAKFTACYAFYTLMWLPTLAYLPVLTNSSLQAVNIDLEQHHILGGYIAVGVVAAVALCVTLVCSLSHLLNLRIIASGVWLLAALLVAGFVVGAVWPIFELEKWYIVTWQIDPWPILTTYIGLALAGAMFLSIGLLISSLVNSQMIAALIALFLGMIFVVGAVWRPEMDTSDLPYRILNYFTVPWHFERNFGRGLIDTRNLVLYASVALLGLFLTVRSLESRRWR